MAEVRELIVQKAEAGGETLASLSKAIGKNHAYLQQFVKRGVPAGLPEDVRERLAPLLGLNPNDLRDNSAGQPSGAPPYPVIQEVSPGPEIPPPTGRFDIPVLGITVGTDDPDSDRSPDFWMNGEIVNYVARPKGLANAKGVFSLYVGGTSMFPRYRDRDLVLVQKAAPAIGDDVVIELHPKFEGADHGSFIKELVAKRGSYLTVRQFNPPKEIDFDLKEILNLFRVIPTKEWVG